MLYLVTGATGFIGGRLVRQLIAAGHEVRVLVRSLRSAADLALIGAAVFEGDISDRRSLRAPMRGAYGVFHVAAWYRIGAAADRAVAERVNVDGTRNVLELAREFGVAKTVYTSTLAVFSDTRGRLVDETYQRGGPWLSEYDRTKWRAHYEVAEPLMRDGVPIVVVQPGVVYGPGDTGPMRPLFVDYVRRRLLVLPTRTAYCWGHVEDTAAAHLLAMERGRVGESYIVAGPPHTLVEVFDVAARVTGIRARRVVLPARLLRAAARALELAGRDAERIRVAAGVTYLGSNEKARRELGFAPRPLEEGLRETLRYEIELAGAG